MVVFATALGTCSVSWSARGITGVALPSPRPLRGVDVHNDTAHVPTPIREAIAGMVALLDGERRDLTAITLDEGDIDAFRRSVYAAARNIAPGTVATYGEVARTIGSPDAARAVGAALGSNPWPIIVPCHRVLAADGALTGFSAPGGIVTKRRMLEIENVPGFAQASLFA
jgi:methylated-DNA-[protein]-cysteine S-methyltransferase